jgi:hypothetical protein
MGTLYRSSFFLWKEKQALSLPTKFFPTMKYNMLIFGLAIIAALALGLSQKPAPEINTTWPGAK